MNEDEKNDWDRKADEIDQVTQNTKVISGFYDRFKLKERITVAPTLTERQAKFVYDGARLAAQAAKAPIIPVPWDEREAPFKDQFLKVIERQMGDQRSKSPEELHGSWMQAYFAMGWVYGPIYDREKKIHPDLVPYADLGQLERDKDAVFVALCEIARQWVYDMPETPEDKLCADSYCGSSPASA